MRRPCQDLYLLPNQGAEAVVSGSRDGRAWGETRLNAGRRLLTSRIFIKAVLKR